MRRQITSGDTSIQCHIGMVSRSAVCMSDASVQTEYYDVTSELQQQIRNLAEVVKQLTSLRYIHKHEPKIPASAPILFDVQLSDPVLDPALSPVIETICNRPFGNASQNAASANPIESTVQPTCNHNHEELRYHLFVLPYSCQQDNPCWVSTRRFPYNRQHAVMVQPMSSGETLKLSLTWGKITGWNYGFDLIYQHDKCQTNLLLYLSFHQRWQI